MARMGTTNRTAILALAAAGALWGLTVPLSKLSLEWLGPAWLTVARFAAAAPLLALAGRHGLRAACTWRVVAAGAVGFGAVIVLQNAGIERTSASHAALVVGAVPVLVALIAAGIGQSATRPIAWAGYAVALAGIALVAHAGGGGATAVGDLLVLASVAVSAAFIVLQPALLAGRDAAAVTAVQFAAGAVFAAPIAVVAEGAPSGPAATIPAAAVAALAIGGTLLPFWLFAFAQARVPAALAGAFVNLEPVVGAAGGWLVLGESAAAGQLAGAVAVLVGIALSTLAPRVSARRGAEGAADDERRAVGELAPDARVDPGCHPGRPDQGRPRLSSTTRRGCRVGAPADRIVGKGSAWARGPQCRMPRWLGPRRCRRPMQARSSTPARSRRRSRRCTARSPVRSRRSFTSRSGARSRSTLVTPASCSTPSPPRRSHRSRAPAITSTLPPSHRAAPCSTSAPARGPTCSARQSGSAAPAVSSASTSRASSSRRQSA